MEDIVYIYARYIMKYIRLGILVVLTFAAILIIASFMIPDGNEKVLEKLNAKGIVLHPLVLSYHDSLKVKLMTTGDSAKQPLLLIHGSPGDWGAWENIIANDSIRERFYIISVDRAGYGETTVPALSKLSDQADVIWQALEQINITQKITISGHSYGGAVVEQLIIDHPHSFAKVIFAAPTLGPELMAPRWYNKVANWALINAILPKDLKASNIEMMGLPESLKLNEQYLSKINIPIVYIQGLKDVLVPYETVDYFKLHKNTGVKYIIIKKMNHFIPWSHPYLITDSILDKLDKY